MFNYVLFHKAFCLKHSSKKDDRRSLANGIDIDDSMTDEERTELRSHRSVTCCGLFIAAVLFGLC